MIEVKYLNRFLIFAGLFILDMLYSSIIILLFKEIGIDIASLNNKYQTISFILIDLSFMLILYIIFRKELNRELIKYFKNFKDYFGFGFKCWIFGLLIMMISNIIIQLIYPSTADNEAAIQNALTIMPIYIAFSSCIFAPFAEEIIFRKSLRKVFNNDVLFIIFSGLLFGLVHNLTNLNSLGLLYIIPYGSFGAVFAYMYVKTNNIFSSITFHFIHNTILISISLMSSGVI